MRRSQIPIKRGLARTVQSTKAPATRSAPSLRLPMRLAQRDHSSLSVQLDLKTDWRQTITVAVSIVSALIVAIGIFYTNEANRRQQDTTLQGQIADRFARAVEQLDHEDEPNQKHLSVRLGAIYQLERLMHDSPPDEKPVIEVLCAFIRTHAPDPGRPIVPADRPNAIDVQAALTVLSRRPRAHDAGNSRLDLTGSRIAMPNTELPGAQLAGADLSNANFRDSNLSGADLSGATLRHAIIDQSDLSSANLHGADLSNAWIGSNLSNADLREALLGSARMASADLTNAKLWRAGLYGTDLTYAKVTSEQIRCAFVDQATILPQGVQRPVENAPLTDPSCK